MTKKRAKEEMVPVHPVIWEQLWRVVDASRMAICPLHGQEKDDALSFLADQEKMLRRAVGLGDFASVEENEKDWREKTGVTKHPYTLDAEAEAKRVRESLFASKG